MEIKTNIPVPSPVRAMKYPFDQMTAGDSLSIETDEQFTRARRASAQYARRHRVKFTSRSGYYNGEPSDSGGMIWMIEDNR